MFAFSSNEVTVLERKADIQGNVSSPVLSDVDSVYGLDKCAKWAKENRLSKICLQFPDSILHHAGMVSTILENKIGCRVYILGDTSYGSCCVDEVAAQHVNADGIIHFGHACLTATNNLLPQLYIFEKLPIDCHHFSSSFRCVLMDKFAKILLLYDVGYQHAIESIKNILAPEYHNLIVSEIVSGGTSESEGETKLGRNFKLQEDSKLEDYYIVFIGKDGPTLSNIVILFQGKLLYWYDPSERKELEPYNANNNKFLMKRMHLIERVKDAQTLGILVGTLGASNYLSAVNRMKELAKQRGKKYYIIAVGKPNVAKLANFPEIDAFVLIACPENSLLDSKEFYRPIVTPYEVELACNLSREWSENYVLEFQHLLPGGRLYQRLEDNADETSENASDVSLVTGRVRVLQDEPCDSSLFASNVVALKGDSTVSTNLATGTEFLSRRTWQGLEQKLGETEVTLASKGQSGIPQNYDKDVDAMLPKK
ncbi:2-(3-amino-3-carboxypropyl)histidine synthase subunit 2 [Periplaneta americana]|uniref:2-(3-amino-3-carboxypropyl)histidine synthase subunit 2 n=1 Tax=Periplaneta americana TaxID=6978 RepID=UPI0037E926B8